MKIKIVNKQSSYGDINLEIKNYLIKFIEIINNNELEEIMYLFSINLSNRIEFFFVYI